MEQLKDLIVALLEDKGATDVSTISLAGKTVIADYFVLATGRSTTNVRALADYVEDKMEKEHGVAVTKREGRDEAQWIVLDYNDVLVHIFTDEIRKTYSLESLWASRPVENLDDNNSKEEVVED